MKLLLHRKYLKKDYTIGILYVDGDYFSEVIEDTVRDLNKDGDFLDEGESKIKSKTAIPYGIYTIELSMSPKFKRVLPLLKDVRHFEGIRIHRGVNAESSAGCLIVGNNKIPGGVINSTDCEMRLISLILSAIYRGEVVQIEII